MNRKTMEQLGERSSLAAGGIDISAVAGVIARTQRATGEIPWFEGEKTDPWDHIEAAMGLCIGGYYEEARKAFDWLIERQLEDGSWYASYINGVPEDKTRDTNMTAYIAVGALHYYLITGDDDFLKAIWPPVEAAISFALRLQTPNGEIHWAISPDGVTDPVALLTGSSSVYMSLKCAVAIAETLGHAKPEWRSALGRLRDAIRHKPHLFNMTKSRFSMDWFYPVLSGVLTGKAAQERIDRYWKKFMVEEQGTLCVSDEPWVTLAETSELVLALAAMGNRNLAEIVFSWICDKTYDDGSFWCGYTHPDMITWPEDKMTWTNGVVLMAADAIFKLTPACGLFLHSYWEKSGIN